jgi:hypothetical protein
MKLIRGDKLTPAMRRQVLAAFVYRWTTDNRMRVHAWPSCPLCDIRKPYVDVSSSNGHNHPTIPLVSDTEWLRAHAFYMTTAGTLARRKHAEPAFLAE